MFDFFGRTRTKLLEKRIEKLENENWKHSMLSYHLNQTQQDITGIIEGNFKCQGGVNGNEITEPSYFDILKVLQFIRTIYDVQNKRIQISIPESLKKSIVNIQNFQSIQFIRPPGVINQFEIGMIDFCLVVVDSELKGQSIVFSIFNDGVELHKKIFLEYSLPTY